MYFFRTHNFNPLRYNYKNNLPSSSPVVKVIVIVTVFFAAFHVVYMRPNIYLHLYTTKYISAFFTECSTPYDWYKFQSIPSRFTYHIPQCPYTFSRWKHWTKMIRIVILKLDQSQQLRLILVIYYVFTHRICFNDIFKTIFKH